jgi:hypothetical protein
MMNDYYFHANLIITLFLVSFMEFRSILQKLVSQAKQKELYIHFKILNI